jgi:autophagy-related protein 18
VYDTSAKEKINVIKCHRTPILKIAINYNGGLAATCSTQGTMVRVFSLPKGEKLYSFARGIKNTTQYFLNFSRDSQYIVSTSDSGTIHLF